MVWKSIIFTFCLLHSRSRDESDPTNVSYKKCQFLNFLNLNFNFYTIRRSDFQGKEIHDTMNCGRWYTADSVTIIWILPLNGSGHSIDNLNFSENFKDKQRNGYYSF